MKINEQYQDLMLFANATQTLLKREGDCLEEDVAVLNEHVMDVYLNDRLTLKIVCVPQHLAELVLGRLLSENIIQSAADVESIYICEYGKRAKVYLKKNAESSDMPFVETTPTCCTGNRILNDYFIDHTEPTPLSPVVWKREWIFDLADRFASDTPLHAETRATHSCFLSRNGQVLFTCEDIGRHNALDKAIGYALRHDIPLGECILYSSGRIPTDMAMKAIRAGIPVLASKAAPTLQAISLAEEYGLTLICCARRDSMRQYTGNGPSA
ncbi:MAG: formate dehydrogenase accessory sulfurtransferase FdhD [Lachnospiraceae bacterium]|nr:formate dehydrogenase accessory sulfurtransferase FdhD [Lachnospiraceae bacterium]